MEHPEPTGLLDYFLPSNLLDFQAFEERRNARLLIRMSFLLVPLGVLVGLSRYLVGTQSRIIEGEHSATVIAIISISLVCALNPIILKVTGKLTFVSALLCTEWLGLIAFVSANNGGLTAPAATWFPFLPLMAFMLGGKRLALGIAFSTVLLVIGFLVATRMGVVFSDLLSPEAKLVMLFICLIGEVFVYTLFVVFQESTNRSTSEEKARVIRDLVIQSEQTSFMGRMVATVGHEMATPLASVSMAFDLIDRTLTEHSEYLGHLFDDSPEAKKVSDTVNEHFDDMAQLVGDGQLASRKMSDLSHALKNQARVERDVTEGVSVNEVVREALIVANGRTKHFEVRVDYASDVPLVTCNRSHLGQVVINIVGNAADALAEKFDHESWIEDGGPIISVRTEAHSRDGVKGLVICICDNGDGVPQHIRQSVFEMFFTTKPAGVGTGMGLALCAGFMLDQGGDIVLDDDPELGGARFKVWVPAEPQSDRANLKAALD